jgi:glutathione S-transferase
MPNVAKPTLVYFAARGRAEHLRCVLAEAGVDYAERAIDKAGIAASHELPFQAVPVWLEPDGFRLAQSMAIIRYIASTHRLMGQTPREAALCDQMLGAYEDVRGEVRKLIVAPPDGRAAVVHELESAFLPRWMGYLDRWLASNKDGAGFLVGDAMSVADVTLWHLLEYLDDNGFGKPFRALPRLAAYYGRIAARPRIAAWTSSPRRHPFTAIPR